jgi:hypothetical protein
MSHAIRHTSIVVALVFLAGGAPSPGRANTCSASEQQRIDARRQRAIGDLKAGKLAGYRELLRTPDPELSPECRRAQERDFPASTKCTQTEKGLILSSTGEAMDAARSGNLERVIVVIETLYDRLSPACWTAMSYPLDPAVQRACSSEELSLMASSSGRSVAALRVLRTRGDPSPMLQVSLELLSRLSPECVGAVTVAQQAAQQRWRGSPPPGVSNVYDHGGGTYSMPGVGACTPSGCMAF